MKNSAMYAGTFDPITFGHLDLVDRAVQIFDRVVIAVAANPRKGTMFSLDQRRDMVCESVKQFPDVEVVTFNGLLVDFAREIGINLLIRGIRAYADFESEFQMALTNRKLSPDIETLFMMPQESHSYLSSSVVREVASLGGNIGDFVPPCVDSRIREYLAAAKLR